MFLVALGPISTAVLAGVGMTVLLAVLLPGAAPVYAVSFLVAALATPVGLIAASRRKASAAIVVASQLRQAVLDGIEGHQDLILFGETDTARHTISRAGTRLATLRVRLGIHGAAAAAVVQLMMGAALIGTLMTGIVSLRAGEIEGPLLAGLLLAVIASFEASAMLVRSATRLASAAAAAERLQALAEAAPSTSDPVNPAQLPAGGDIAFEDVSFRYGAACLVLDRISFTIDAGACVAIKGPSGSGKSTIAQLLVRLLEPQSGTIRVNGLNIAEVAIADLHQHVALMTQDAPVFNDTVRANLLIGRPDADDADLWRALQTVALADTIKALPRGLDTVLGEAGRTLSAGQARRICLARTLLSDASIIILDEPTSGLDRATELAFLEDLPDATAGRTAIVITHADLPAAFDRVLTLRAGQLAGPQTSLRRCNALAALKCRIRRSPNWLRA